MLPKNLWFFKRKLLIFKLNQIVHYYCNLFENWIAGGMQHFCNLEMSIDWNFLMWNQSGKLDFEYDLIEAFKMYLNKNSNKTKQHGNKVLVWTVKKKHVKTKIANAGDHKANISIWNKLMNKGTINSQSNNVPPLIRIPFVVLLWNILLFH